MNIIESVKEVFGVYGGELGNITKRIEDLQRNQMPEHVEHAQKRFRELTADLNVRSEVLTLREKELLDSELPGLFAILNEYESSLPVRESHVKRLQETKRELEFEVMANRKRLKHLQTMESARVEALITQRENGIAACIRQIDSTQSEIERNMGSLDDQETELKKQRRDSVSVAKSDIDLKIRTIQAIRDKNIHDILPGKLLFIEQKKAEQHRLEVEAKHFRKSLDDAIAECKESILRLTGHTM